MIFKYLGRILTAGDDYRPAVAGNLGKARKSWGTAEADTEQGRGRQESVGKVFQGGSPTGAAVWDGDVGVDTHNRKGVGLVHAWGGETDHGETDAERVVREMVLPLPVGVHEGSGI